VPPSTSAFTSLYDAVADALLDCREGGINAVGHKTGLQPHSTGTPLLCFEGKLPSQGDKLNSAAAVELRGMLTKPDLSALPSSCAINA
jgi:hypothetical protein